MAHDFEREVIDRLARMEEKLDSSDKKHADQYKYRNEEIAPRLAMIDEHEKKIEKHTEGHTQFRMAITVPILLSAGAVLWKLIIRPELKH